MICVGTMLEGRPGTGVQVTPSGDEWVWPKERAKKRSLAKHRLEAGTWLTCVHVMPSVEEWMFSLKRSRARNRPLPQVRDTACRAAGPELVQVMPFVE